MHLHQREVTHGHLKLSNLLLDHNSVIKVSDYAAHLPLALLAHPERFPQHQALLTVLFQLHRTRLILVLEP